MLGDLVGKVAQQDELLAFYRLNTKDCANFKRGESADQWRFEMFLAFKEFDLSKKVDKNTLTNWGINYMRKFPASNKEVFRKMTTQVVKIAKAWQLHKAPPMEVDKTSYSLTGSSFSGAPCFGGQEIVAPAAPKRKRGRPCKPAGVKSASVSCAGSVLGHEDKSEASVGILSSPNKLGRSPSLGSSMDELEVKLREGSVLGRRVQPEEVKTLGGMAVPPSPVPSVSSVRKRDKKAEYKGTVSSRVARASPLTMGEIRKLAAPSSKKEEEKPISAEMVDDLWEVIRDQKALIKRAEDRAVKAETIAASLLARVEDLE
jgi:hypothetical protein